jgi:predicted 3-demethylubiquinone-9 3-methyltransferase (glyoxalase superfamily)
MQKITPFLWFEKDMKGIITYYRSIFPDMKILSGGELDETPSGSVQIKTVSIFGQELTLMAAGPEFKFNESFSLVISCKDQAEIDYYWERLTADGGKESQCGWCKDKYGLSWQVVPDAMTEMMSKGTKEQIGRVTQAFLKMKKFDIKVLEKAFNG